MSNNVYVNADRTAVVEENDPGKKWQMRRKDAQRLGLIPDGEAKPQTRRANKDLSADISRDISEVPEDTAREFGTVPRKTDYAARRAAKK